jgi:hypothetical protein
MSKDIFHGEVFFFFMPSYTFSIAQPILEISKEHDDP